MLIDLEISGFIGATHLNLLNFKVRAPTRHRGVPVGSL